MRRKGRANFYSPQKTNSMLETINFQGVNPNLLGIPKVNFVALK